MRAKYSNSFFLLSSLVLGLSFSGIATAAEDQFKNKDIVRKYDTYCAQCHGINRNGQGINSYSMSVQPRDHSDPKVMGDIPNDEMFAVIKKGGTAVNKSVLMPAWGEVLSDEEIRKMMDYLHYVCQCGPEK